MREGGVPMTVDGRAVSEEPAALRERRVVWPVRSGAVPPLADGFLSRLETAADLAAALVPGATVVLAPGRTPAGGTGEWLASSGKTQVAAGLAESLWDAAKLDLVPKSAKVHNVFQHIVLWIDPAQGISLWQQLFEPSGDYRLAKYTDIHPATDAGKNVYYLLRWQDHKGQVGPWSDVITTRVPG